MHDIALRRFDHAFLCRAKCGVVEFNGASPVAHGKGRSKSVVSLGNRLYRHDVLLKRKSVGTKVYTAKPSACVKEVLQPVLKRPTTMCVNRDPVQKKRATPSSSTR